MAFNKSGVFLLICILHFAVINGNGDLTAPSVEKLDHHKNFLKLAFGVNLDLDQLNEKTVKTISTLPLSDTTATTPSASSCAGLYGPHCTDCNTVKVCNMAETPLSLVSCPSSLPYCNAGICGDKPSSSATCTVPTPTFKCTGVGYFPDPVDCKKFYYCSAESTTTWKLRTYTCPTGFAYSPAKNNCQKTIAACQTFTCTKANQMVVYKQNPAYYGFCTGTSVATSMPVFKCPDTTSMAYNVKTYGCQYQCKAEGYFTDSLDESKYYFCYREATVYKYIHEACPEGYLFRDAQCKAKTQNELTVEKLLALLEKAETVSGGTGNVTPILPQ